MKPSDATKVTPGGAAAGLSRRSPERTCVGCRQTHPKGDLMRLVGSPSGQLMVDPHGKLPGRGAYLCPQRTCVERALKGKQLREALRQEVVSAPLAEVVQQLVSTLEARAFACIHMARKAGRVVSGYTQVRRALTYEPVAFLLMAEDVVPERRREYLTQCDRRRIPSRSLFTKTRLGALVGREESSAIGILDVRLAERLMFDLEGMSRLTER